MAGRPKKEIDQTKFEELCELQCSEKEICETFGVTDKTLSAWCKRTYNTKNFSDTFSQKRKIGFHKLRSKQYSIAMSGNTTMLIWLGRNWLGQTDKPVPEKEEMPESEKKEEIRYEDTDEFKKQYSELKENLLEQLKKRKAITPIYQDMIDDYMTYWTIKEKLKRDIQERGMYITYNNGGGQTGQTDNPSVDKLIKTSSKLKDILLQLEIDLDAVGEEDDEL